MVEKVQYSNGSLYVRGGFRRVGAGALVTHKGANVITRKWPCGSRAEVYDAEMIGLAGGMTAAADYARDCGHRITHILLVADNTAALGEIAKTGAHAMQMASLMFRRAASRFFTGGGTKVTLGWARGHSGVWGNKVADRLAKDAAKAAKMAAVITYSDGRHRRRLMSALLKIGLEAM
jgi:ribonuclease HI